MAPAPTVTITAVNYETGVLTYTSDNPLSNVLLRVDTTAIGFFNLLAGAGNTTTNNSLKAVMYGGITTNGSTVQILIDPSTPLCSPFTMNILPIPVATICKINQLTGTIIYNAQGSETVYVYLNSTQLTPSFTTSPGLLQTITFPTLKSLPYGGTLEDGDTIVFKTVANVEVSNTLTVDAPELNCISLTSLDLETGRLTFSPTANITAYLSIDNGAPAGDPIYTGTLFSKSITSSLLVSSTYGGPLLAGSSYTIRLKTTALETVSDVLSVNVPARPSVDITDLNALTGTVTYTSIAQIRAYITINGVRSQCAFLTPIATGATHQDQALISYLEGGTLENGDIITFTTVAGVSISDSYTVSLPSATVSSVDTSSGLVTFSTTDPMSFYLYINGQRTGPLITATSGTQTFTNTALLSYLYGGQRSTGDYFTLGTASGTMITTPFNITVDSAPVSITAIDYNTGTLSYTTTQPAKVYLYINGVKQPTLLTLPTGSSTFTASALIASIYGGTLANSDQITLVTDIGYVLTLPNPYTASFPTSPTATITGLDQYSGQIAYTASDAVVVKVLKNNIPTGTKFTLTPPTGTITSTLFKSDLYGGPIVNGDKLRIALDGSNTPISPEFTVSVPTPPFITINSVDYTTGDMTFTSEESFTGFVSINSIPTGTTQTFTGSPSPQIVNRPGLRSTTNGGQVNNGDLIRIATQAGLATVVLSDDFNASVSTPVILLNLEERTGELTYESDAVRTVKIYLNGSDSGLSFTASTPTGSFTDIALVSDLYGGTLANNTTIEAYDVSPAPISNVITSSVPSIPCVTITAVDFTTGQVTYDATLSGTIQSVLRLEGTEKGTSFTITNGSSQTVTVAALASIYNGGESQDTDEIVVAATTTAGVAGTGQIISNTFNVSITPPITIDSVDITNGTLTYTTSVIELVEVYINNSPSGFTFTTSTTPSTLVSNSVLYGTIYGGTVGNAHPIELRKAGVIFSNIVNPTVPPANTTITLTAIDYDNGILYYTAAATTVVSVYINGTSYGATFTASTGSSNVTRTQLKAVQFGGLLLAGDQVRLGTNVPIYMSDTFTAAPPNPIAITITNVNQATGQLTYTATSSGFNASPFVNNVSTGQVFTVQGSDTYPFGSTLVTTLNGGAVANSDTITIKNTLGILISNTFTVTFPTLPVATINYFRGTDGTFGYTSTAAIKAKIYINGSDLGAATITLAANSPGTDYITASQLKTTLYGGSIANGDLLSLITLDGLQDITTADYTVSVPTPPFVTITALDLVNGIISYTSTAEAQAFLQINGVTIPGSTVQTIETSPPTRTITSPYLAAVANGGAVSDGSPIRFYTSGGVTISSPYTATVPIVIYINSLDPSSGDVKYICDSTISVYPAINGVPITGPPYPITIATTVSEAIVNIPEFSGLPVGDYISFILSADSTTVVSTTYYAYWLQYSRGILPDSALVSDTQVNLLGTDILFSSRQGFGTLDNFTFKFTLPTQTLQSIGNQLNITMGNGLLNLRVISSTDFSAVSIINGRDTYATLYSTTSNIMGNEISINYIKPNDIDYNTLYEFIYIKNETLNTILSSMSILGANVYGAPGTPPLSSQGYPPYYISIQGAIGYNPPNPNIPYSITNMTRQVTVKPSLPTTLTPTCYLFNNQKTALSPYQMPTSTDPTLLFQASVNYLTVGGNNIGYPLWLDDGSATGKIFTTNSLISTTDGSYVYRINTNAEMVAQTIFEREIRDTLQTIPACDNKGYLYGASQVVYWRVDQRIAYPTWRTTINSPQTNGAVRDPLLTTTGYLFCFNRQNGMNKINTSTGLSVASCTFTGSLLSVTEMVMTSDQSFIYFIGRDSSFYYLYKIQTSDCTEVSRTTLSGFALDEIQRLYFDGTIIYACRDVILYAIDAATGALLWTDTSAAGVIRSIAIGPTGTIFFAARDGKVRAINSSGVIQWTSSTIDANNQHIIVDQANRVYCAGDNPSITLTALDGGTGAQFWQKSYSNMIRAPAIGSDGKLYVIANNTLYVYSN